MSCADIELTGRQSRKMAAESILPPTTNGHPKAHRSPPDKPLKVTVVGGGIASLVAAIALRQQGHDVTIYEKSKFANETGAAIHCTPNANSALRHLGIDPAERGAVPLLKVRSTTSSYCGIC